MKDINKVIQELYWAYVQKDFILMKSLLEEGKQIDPDNTYLKKYESLYNSQNSNNWTTSPETSQEKVVQFWWKTLQCPHCGGNLSMSDHNKKSIEEYKAWNSKDLNFICKYCNTNFTWNQTWMKSLYLNISVWHEITLDNKKYRVCGWIRYVWTWETDNSGKLEYIERILVDDKGDTYYLSESKAWWNEWWESWIEYQTEISRKIVPDFNIWWFNQNSILLDGTHHTITEICSVKALESYGENSKSYTLWEEITTYQLNYKGKNYIFEKEKTKNQQEIWVYHTWEINDTNLRNGNIWYNQNASPLNFDLWNLQNLSSFLGKNYIIWSSTALKTPSSILPIWKIILFFVVVFISFQFMSCERKVQDVNIQDLAGKDLQQAKWLYKIQFWETYKKDVSDSTKSYDYWGVNHTIKSLQGIKFKIETQKDLDLLKDISAWKLELQSSQIPTYTLDFSNKSFSQYFTDNSITNFK
jgi:hypothetical protein